MRHVPANHTVAPSVRLYHHTSFSAWNAILKSRILYGSRVAFTEALSEQRTLVPHVYTRDPYIYLTQLPRLRRASELKKLLISPRIGLVRRGVDGVPEALIPDPTTDKLRSLGRRLPSGWSVSATGTQLKRYSWTIELRVPPAFVDDGIVSALLPIRRIPAAKLRLGPPAVVNRSRHRAVFEITPDNVIGFHPVRVTFSDNWVELHDVSFSWARCIAAFRDNLLPALGPSLTSLILAAVVSAEEMGVRWVFRPLPNVQCVALMLSGDEVLRAHSSGHMTVRLGSLTAQQRRAVTHHLRQLRIRIREDTATARIGKEVTALRELLGLLRALISATPPHQLFLTHMNAY